MEKFSTGLTSDEKKDVKVIEDKFRTFCKGTKGKDNRFVSIPNYKLHSSGSVLNGLLLNHLSLDSVTILEAWKIRLLAS